MVKSKELADLTEKTQVKDTWFINSIFSITSLIGLMLLTNFYDINFSAEFYVMFALLLWMLMNQIIGVD